MRTTPQVCRFESNSGHPFLCWFLSVPIALEGARLTSLPLSDAPSPVPLSGALHQGPICP